MHVNKPPKALAWSNIDARAPLVPLLFRQWVDSGPNHVGIRSRFRCGLLHVTHCGTAWHKHQDMAAQVPCIMLSRVGGLRKSMIKKEKSRRSGIGQHAIQLNYLVLAGAFLETAARILS